MSKIQGLVPLFLATAFGIANGVAIFQPAFLDQQRQKQAEQRQQTETIEGLETGIIETENKVPMATDDNVTNGGSVVPMSDGSTSMDNRSASKSHP